MAEAKSILEQLGITTKNSVTVTLNGKVELTFVRDDAAYDAFLNEFREDNKLTPAKDYLQAIVAPDDRETLLTLLPYSDIAMSLLKEVNTAFKPKFELTLKN